MPKSQIIIDIVEDKVPIEQSMSRLLVLAKDIKNSKLEKWALNELNGYKNTEDVPEYRRNKCCMLEYSGINGSYQVANAHLSNSWFDEKLIESMSDIVIVDGLMTISEILKNGKNPVRDVSELSGIVYDKSERGISCTSISQIIPITIYRNVCAEVKTKMITALCELEKRYGGLDNLGIDISNKKSVQVQRVNEDVNRTVFNINVSSPEENK